MIGPAATLASARGYKPAAAASTPSVQAPDLAWATPADAPPERRDDVRMLTIELGALPDSVQFRDGKLRDLVAYLGPGDVLVVNDAATLPASLHGRSEDGSEIELRLVGPAAGETWTAVLFGAGDWHTPTEHRPAPPVLGRGGRIVIGPSSGGLVAEITDVSPISPRLLSIVFDRSGSALWEALYAAGKPVQYSYLRNELALWSVQTVYSGRPWAVEMPSAGRPLTWTILRALRSRGVAVVPITHAAGLSSTGDPAIDRMLPLPERFDVPEATVAAITAAKRAGGRIIAVGTTVVRALEGNALLYGELRPASGVTDLVIDRSLRLAVVDGLLTGVHEPTASHYQLLGAFAGEEILAAAWDRAARLGYRYHELGDTSLIVPAKSRI